MAAIITVRSASTHQSIAGVTMAVNGGEPTPCSGLCVLSAGAGEYQIDIGAPGYQTARQTITVTESQETKKVYGPNGYEGESCACTVVNEHDIAIELVPVAS